MTEKRGERVDPGLLMTQDNRSTRLRQRKTHDKRFARQLMLKKGMSERSELSGALKQVVEMNS